jgi:hypothetical protein
MKSFVCAVLLSSLGSIVFAQAPAVDPITPRVVPFVRPATPIQMPACPPALKRPGHYSVTDWRRLADSTWGPGATTADKLALFDAFCDNINWFWGGFPNLVVNWDSLRVAYRPIVTAGVSRGRFEGIMSRMARALSEWHVYFIDLGIDSAMFVYTDNPPGATFWYRPGIPLLNLDPLRLTTPLGAALAAVNDTIAIVCRSAPDHPMGLQPGDIILGYDGRPWRSCLSELIDAELPELLGGAIGSTPAAVAHCLAMSVGLNWGLFDTMDVMKYPGNELVHYPTSLLNSLQPPYPLSVEQLAVPGVSFPNVVEDTLVSWGVVEGTDIGYVYAMDWGGWTERLFERAIRDLTTERRVRGLILDFRTNLGGSPGAANGGFRQLFGFDPTSNYSLAIRQAGSDHFSFRVDPPFAGDHFTPSLRTFTGPIAVLTGPLCGSAGDYNAFRLRFHPMVRFFGKPTAGAYTASSFVPGDSLFPTMRFLPYVTRADNGTVFSNLPGEGYMIHKAFPVDEDVWLTREGIARGEDNVVASALEWIQHQTYVCDVNLPSYANPGVDTLTATATLINGAGHEIDAALVLTDTNGTALDSASLTDVGMNILRARMKAPSAEGVFTMMLRSHDRSTGVTKIFPRADYFVTFGPVECTGDTLSAEPTWGARVMVRLRIRNGGKTLAFPQVTAAIRSLDTAATLRFLNRYDIGSLAPGQVRLSPSYIIDFSPWGSGVREIPFEVICSNAQFELGRDTLLIRVSLPSDVASQQSLPLSWQLEQNYPNPFNPTTSIGYSVGVVGLPAGQAGGQSSVVSNHVRLAVYDLLGREVAVLVNEKKEAGRYEVKWDASGFASGVYFCRLTAGTTVLISRMMLVK